MLIRVIEYDGTEHLLTCKSFEFRTNQCSNWIKIKLENETKTIHNVAVIKTVS